LRSGAQLRFNFPTRHRAVTQLPSHKLILVVEDDDDIREGVSDLLRDAGRNVIEARDGVEALSLLESLPRPCLVLLDLMMPRMDGYEFMLHLREKYDATDFPVLVISAHDSIEAAQGHPGVLGTLRKPFDVHRLLTFVDAYC
jgi:CheY-like chemotaxis protein